MKNSHDVLIRTVLLVSLLLCCYGILASSSVYAQVGSHQKISSTEGNFGNLIDAGDLFGGSVANIGDLDGDGVTDLAVGASRALWILFMDVDGAVKNHQKISDNAGGFTGTGLNVTSLASLGDLDGDGVSDLAVGNSFDGGLLGAVWILFLNADGTVKSHQKISDTEGGFTGQLDDDDEFGASVANLGDLDGDGVLDLAVGAIQDDFPLFRPGAVWILFLNADGTVKSHQKISNAEGGFTGQLDAGDLFGASITNLGDFDDDGIIDLAVGASEDDDGSFDRGAVWLLFLNADGTVKSHQKISDTEGGFLGGLNNSDRFGSSVENIGDLDGDGIIDLAVGAVSGAPSGVVWILFLNGDGTVRTHQKISDIEGGFNGSGLGVSAIASLGDLDGDGIFDLAVGSSEDSEEGFARGAFWILYLDASGTVKGHRKIGDADGVVSGQLNDLGEFGTAAANIGDFDGDGVPELAIGAPSRGGVVWLVFLNADGTVKRHPKIKVGSTSGFGEAVTNLGDFDGDGVTDLAVGDPLDNDGGIFRGAIWILFLNADGTVKSHQKISDTEGGFTGQLNDEDQFGASVANLGDLDSDGVTDVAVGAFLDDDGGTSSGSNRGAVWILFLNADGTVKSHQKISATEGGFSDFLLQDFSAFGASVAGVGDFDSDNVPDLAVGAIGAASSQGVMWILFLNVDGTVKNHQRTVGSSGSNGQFGRGIANLGDLDGDGVPELAVGASGDRSQNNIRGGAVWLLFMNPDGTVKARQKIGDMEGGFTGSLDNSDFFGTSVVRLGDLDGNGLTDLVVGSPGDDDGGTSSGSNRGAVWVLFTNGVVLGADLAIRKTIDNPTPGVGDQVTFTVTLTNNGPNDASGVLVTDREPQGLTFDSVTPSRGSYFGSSGVWSIGDLASGSSETLTILATVNQDSASINTATITALDQPDPDLTNNSAVAIPAANQAILTFNPASFSDTLASGASTTDMLTIGNAGADTLQWQVSSNSPWLSAAPDTGTVNPGDSTLITINIDAAGLSTNIHAGTLTITTNDPDQPAAQVSVSLAVGPDLKVADVQIPPEVFSGQTIEVTWTVTNRGKGNTGTAQWFDRIYRSAFPDFNFSTATILGTVENLTALAGREAYTNTATFALPRDLIGEQYVFITSDIASNVVEFDENNNRSRSAAATQVLLSPQTDLQVTTVVAPGSAFSEQDVNVTWTVRNVGAVPTDVSQWTDAIYLSADTVLSTLDDPLLKSVQHTGTLAVDSSYTQSAAVTLPQGIFGTYYLFVWADRQNKVFEFLLDGNNTGQSNPINITLAPPPDLQVASLNIPGSVTSGQSIDVTWTVENFGAGATSASRWSDSIYLSADAVLDTDEDIQLATRSQIGALGAGESYTRTVTVTPSHTLSGTHYIFAVTDADDEVFEFNAENNNSTNAAIDFTLVPPDLVVTSIIVPDSASSGKRVNVTWTVQNQGPGATFETLWEDQVYLSTEPVFNRSNATELGSFSRFGVLDADSTYTASLNVSLPNGISGDHYIYVETDWRQQVFEFAAEGNNLLRSGTVSVELSPWADLQVSTLAGPGAATAGEQISVAWAVINAGIAAANGAAWTDRIFISTEPVWDSTATRLGALEHQMIVAPGESYSKSLLVTLPTGLAGGDYYLYLFTDIADQVFEHTDEGNNIGQSMILPVAPYPPIDLAVQNLVIPSSGATGQPISIQWSVANIGQSRTLNSTWRDDIYLSADTDLDLNADIFLTSVNRVGALGPGGSYMRDLTVVLPNEHDGDFFLILANSLADSNPANNVVSSAINIQRSPSPDLVIASFTGPAGGAAGQPITISWTIENQGDGATQQDTWFEAVYLSEDTNIGKGDVRLGTFRRDGTLAPTESYTDSMVVTLPTTASETQYLLFRTDNNDDLFEFQGENNNVVTSQILVIRQPPSDLIVSSITIPATATPGEDVSISWTLTNQGPNPAVGRMRDGVYISADPTWEVEDALLGVVEQTINLVPGASSSVSFKADLSKTYRADEFGNITGELPGVTPGDYYVIVRTDLRNSIAETDEANNTSASSDSMLVDVPVLVLGVPQTNSLAAGETHFYRVDASPRQTVSIQLDSESATATNELYVAFERTPTFNNFDFSFSEPFSPDQAVTIPSALNGPYYLMVHSRSQFEAAAAYTLRADSVTFSVLSANTSVGGNTGRVTTEIRGAKFDTLATAFLHNANNVIAAERIVFVDPSRLFVTFNLTGVTPESYDVVIMNTDSSTATLPNGFAVVPGDHPNLFVDIRAPSETRPGRVIEVTVNYRNAGNVDIERNDAFFRMYSGGAIGFSSEELGLGYTWLHFPLIELGDAPWDILRPGASGAISAVASVQRGLLSLGVILPDLGAERGNPGRAIAITSPETDVKLRDLGDSPPTPMIIIEEGKDTPSWYFDEEAGQADTPLGDLDIRTTSGKESVTFEWNVSNGNNIEHFSLVCSGHAPLTLDGSTRAHTVDRLPLGKRWCSLAAVDAAGNRIASGIAFAWAHPLTIGQHLNRNQWNLEAKGTLTRIAPSRFGFDRYRDELGTVWTRVPPTLFGKDLKTEEFHGKGSIKFLRDAQQETISHPFYPFPQLEASYETIRVDQSTDCRFVIGDNIRDTKYQQSYNFADGFPRNAGQAKHNLYDVNPHFDISFARIDFEHIGFGYDYRTPLISQFGTCTEQDADLDKCGPCAKELFPEKFEEGGECHCCDKKPKDKCAVPPCGPCPDPGKPDKCIPTRNRICQSVPVVTSWDPNDILGPEGFGDQKWIPAEEPLLYTIRFENDPVWATAPAQRVTITQTLDPDLAVSSFRLGSFGFGPLVFEVPENRSFYTARVDATDSLGVLVDVTAGFDVTTNTIFWTLQSIDPLTGQPPDDPLAGFLPPNDSTGIGEGFVTYTVRPGRNAQTGAVIDAEAEIVFDINEPILTPAIFNTLDTESPASSVNPLPTTLDSTSFFVTWAGQDATPGSGIATYDLYVSEDGRPFRLHEASLTDTLLIFNGALDHTYGFFTVATDNAGNVEPNKTTAEATVELRSLSGTTTYALSESWNLIGLPVEVENAHYKALFPSALDSTLFGFDGTYVQPELAVLELGKGYWLRFSEAEVVSFTGTPVATHTLTLEEGWSLVSGLNCIVPLAGVDDPGAIIIDGTLHGFDQGYFAATTLDPGKGYWLRTSAAGAVTLRCGGSAPVATPVEVPEAFGMLAFSDDTGAGRTLAFGSTLSEEMNPLSFSLPPLPPGRLFDVRFSDGFSLAEVEDLTSGREIAIQTPRFPVRVTVDRLPSFASGGADRVGAQRYILEALVDGEPVASYDLLEGQELQITDQRVTHLRLRLAAEELPTEFVLKQNYPNPFNPSTTIEYELPEAVRVRLVIYDLLGRMVALLVDEEKPAGRYKVVWDARSVASGVYFYRMQAEDFTRTRKLVFVK